MNIEKQSTLSSHPAHLGYGQKNRNNTRQTFTTHAASGQRDRTSGCTQP